MEIVRQKKRAEENENKKPEAPLPPNSVLGHSKILPTNLNDLGTAALSTVIMCMREMAIA